ncbi:IL15 protein, partial [Machaerirhynchus nigripectus]|nr:IL15 protein [Machaerirhynchus nigripectus]
MMCKVLIFGCIAAVILMTASYGAPLTTEPPPTQEAQLLRAAIMDLEQLKNFKNNFLDFYTPNDTGECNRTTLECFLRELEVLKEDVGQEDQRHIINIKKNLDYFKAGNSSDLTCKMCESNEKKKFSEFYQALNRFLQSMLK